MRFITFLLLSFCVLPVLANDGYSIEKKPSWVTSAEALSVDNVPHTQVRNGVYYLLVDNQVNVPSKGQPSYYTRYADLITNQSGLDSESQINVDFDPSYQKVALHAISVIRDGVTIDKLTSARLTLLDQEDELDSQIYNGDKTINILLADIRVGDVLDYSFTIIGDNPVFNGIYSDSYRLQWGVPVGKVRLRVLWHKSTQLHSKVMNSQLTLRQRKLNDGTEYWLEADDMPVHLTEDDAPEWVNEFARIYFSESGSWQSIVDWGVTLFDKAIESDPNITNLASTLSNGAKNDNDKIKRALQYVQSEVRYVGIELGVNSHQAAKASRTLERRYGDCKDKSALLITLLKEMGIEAYPALINTRIRHKLSDRLPSMTAFDHVITTVNYEGKQVWLDPTREYQFGNIDEIYQPKYGLSLVLKPGNTALESIPLEDDVTSTELVEQFDLSAADNDIINYKIRSIYRGLSAEKQRRYVQRKGLDSIGKDYLSFYQDYYSDIEMIHIPIFDDNNQQSTMYLNEAYRIPGFWQEDSDDDRDSGWVYGSAIDTYLKNPDGNTRTQDYELVYPKKYTQKVKIQLSQLDWSFNDETFEEDNEFFNYTRTVRFNKPGNFLNVEFSYLSKTDHVSALGFPDYKAAIIRANDENQFGFYRTPIAKAVTENTDDVPGEDYWLVGFVVVYVALWILLITLWRMDVKRHPYSETMAFYPVSVNKFMLMWILTLGAYSWFWFYRNWRYVKFNLGQQKVSPIWRAVFQIFWFYPLYKLVETKLTETDVSELPRKSQAISLTILFILTAILSYTDNVVAYLSMIASAIITLPLLSMINRMNQSEVAAYAQNSAWRLRHGLLTLLIIPFLILAVGSETGLLSSSKVIEGDFLWPHDVRFMQRQNIIEPGDDIHYFYSDALFQVQNDGNGFSDRHVFSYWIGDDGKLQYDTIEYHQIKDIQVTWSNKDDENTVVEVFDKADKKMLLFLSTEEEGDEKFVREMKALWQVKK